MPNSSLDNSSPSKISNVSHDDGLQEFNEDEFKLWLKDLGLQFNPFDLSYLDAGKDPQLPAYLIGHESFTAIWQNKTSFVFAPVGGGKTAFRVRLARACRVGQDGRRIFPIIYKMPSPTRLKGTIPYLDKHLTYINHAAAQELLLTLAYNPTLFLESDINERTKICELLTTNLPFDLENYLQQLSDKGTLMPLVELFAPTAERLFTLPHPDEVRRFCSGLMEVSQPSSAPTIVKQKKTANERFEELVQFLQEILGYEAVYILVDGVDAHVEAITRPDFSIELIKPLLAETYQWARNNIFVKYFLPIEFDTLISLDALAFPGERTEIDIVRIIWTQPMLEELLQERLRVASRGKFNSLDAICSPEMHGTIQEDLILATRSKLPREVLALAAYLLQARFRRTKESGLVESIDFETAKQRYEEEIMVGVT